MGFVDAFMTFIGIAGAGCFAYGVACAIEARRAHTVLHHAAPSCTTVHRSESSEAACASE